MSSDGTVTYYGTDLEAGMTIADRLTPSAWFIIQTFPVYDYDGENAYREFTETALLVRPAGSPRPSSIFVVDNATSYEVLEP